MGRSLLLFTLSTVLCAQAPQEPAHIKFFQAVNAAQKGGTVTIRWSATGVERLNGCTIVSRQLFYRRKVGIVHSMLIRRGLTIA